MPDDPTTIAGLIRLLRDALISSGRSEAALDARMIVQHAAGATPLEIVTDAHRPVTAAQAATARILLGRRLAGEPVHRILGSRGFHGLDLTLSSETLEPRPDTEALVDLVLPFVRAAADHHGSCRVLDLGTGTGAIALALIAMEPRGHALGTDVSVDALATAVRNADINNLSDRFDAVESDWYAAIEGLFHIIVSNPPYIRSRAIETLSAEVRLYDPICALDGGEDGLHAYRQIAVGAVRHLHEDGIAAVEIGYDQAEDVMAIFAKQGMRLNASAKDLAGHIRALAFSRS